MRFRLFVIFLLIFAMSVTSLSHSIPIDKLKHIAISFSISLFLYPYTGYPENLLATLGIGLGKEVYDLFSKTGHADIEDLIADLYGVGLSVKEFSRCMDRKLCVGLVWVF